MEMSVPIISSEHFNTHIHTYLYPWLMHDVSHSFKCTCAKDSTEPYAKYQIARVNSASENPYLCSANIAALIKLPQSLELLASFTLSFLSSEFSNSSVFMFN
jgi:hypothetical protein